MTKQIPITWRERPFDGARHSAYLPEGVSIADIVESISDLPPFFDTQGIVCVNGEKVERDQWRFVRPKARDGDVVVTLHVLPGNSGTLRTVASIAILVAAIAVSGGAAAAIPGLGALTAGSIAAGVAGAGVSVVGALAIIGASK